MVKGEGAAQSCVVGGADSTDRCWQAASFGCKGPGGKRIGAVSGINTGAERASQPRRIPETVLAAFSIGAFLVMLITVFTTGPVAMWALISVGLFHSIMFPTIFTLGIKGLGPVTEEASGLLIMAIARGALVYFQGKLADAYGLQTSFLLTAACELYILFYALWGSRTAGANLDRMWAAE